MNATSFALELELTYRIEQLEARRIENISCGGCVIQIRRSQERGHANHGWLDSFHTFSFANYYDPQFMGFRDLRVINEDRIAAGSGFGTHPHKDMEIITYVIEGALAHKDSMGNSTDIHAGEVQRMSAGTGVQHSEHNPKVDQLCHLLQIWIMPQARGIEPSYGQKSFADQLSAADLTLVISRDGREGSITINQDVNLYVGKWEGGRSVEFSLDPRRYAWLQVIAGDLSLNGETLHSGDGAAVASESVLKLDSRGPVHFLLFDLP